MASITRNISANLLANVWLTALTILLTPMYVRFLGIESYGLIGFYASWLAVAGILDTGISAAASREFAWLAAKPESVGKMPVLLRSLEVLYWALMAILGLGLVIWIWVSGERWFQSSDITAEALQQALALMAVSLVIQVPSGLYVSGLMGLQRQTECSGLLALLGTLRLAGALLVLWINPDIRVFFIWQIVGNAIQTLTMRWVLRRRIGAPAAAARFSADILKSIGTFASGMTLVTAFSIVLTQADKIILSRTVPLEVLGYYMLAWLVASGLSRIAVPLVQAYGPRFTELVSKGDEHGLARQFRLAAQAMNAVILPPVALLIVLPEEILNAWTGTADIVAGAAPILVPLALGAGLTACSYPALSLLYSKKRLRPVVMVNGASVGIFLPLLVLVAGRWGAMGAASLWVACSCMGMIAYYALALRLLRPGLLRFFARDFIMCCAISAVVALAAQYGLRDIRDGAMFAAMLGLVLATGWTAALLGYRDVRLMLRSTLGRVCCPFR